LPFLEILLGLRQFHDVVGGIAQSQQLAPTRWQDRIIEEASPSGNRLQIVRSAIRDQGCAGRSFPRLRPPRFPGRLFRFPEPLTELVQFGNLKKEIG
jgi:hypothetical protein